MKISILLPYKENFSPHYPGAVSLFVNDTLKLTNLKKVKVYGNTNFKKNFQKIIEISNLKIIFWQPKRKLYG